MSARSRRCCIFRRYSSSLKLVLSSVFSQRVREVREHEQALRPGAVYCYFAGSSHAEGCRPTEPRQVFDGYSSTGKPQFADFVTMAIERKDPDVERLLADVEAARYGGTPRIGDIESIDRAIACLRRLERSGL